MRYLAIFLLMCLPCWAADKTVYVWPDATGSGNGSSWENAYVNLAAMETAEDGLTQGGHLTVECKVTSTLDTTSVTFGGWANNDASHTITVQSSDRSYRIAGANRSADMVVINVDFITFRNIKGEISSVAANGADIFYVSGIGATNSINFDSCTILGASDATYRQAGIHINDADANVNIWNTLIYGIYPVDNGNAAGIYVVLSTVVNIYNTTVVGGKYGVEAVSGTVVCQNVVALGSLTADFYDAGAGATTTQIHCASEDATGDDFDTNADGNIVSQTLTAFSATYRLIAKNPCIDAGTDLSGATPAVTDDIDGTARGATYDIGCSEYVTPPPVGSKGFRRAVMW
jgi:hypothetical protein